MERAGATVEPDLTLDGSPVEITAHSIAGLRSMRETLAQILAASRWRRTEIVDAQLVLVELATNAFVHDGAARFSAVVTCSDRQLELRTFHPGRVAPPRSPVPDGASGGRGLVTVDEIVDERFASSRAGITTTYVRMSRSPARIAPGRARPPEPHR